MTAADGGLRVGWKVASLSADTASVRYRALLPILALADKGVSNRIFCHARPDELDDLDVLVLVKSFQHDALELARQASDRFIPVIADLCDNVFVDGYPSSTETPSADHFRAIAHLAALVVVTTEPLADAVRMHVGPQVPIRIVPDGIENPALVAAGAQLLAQARRRERRAWWCTIPRKIVLSVRRAELPMSLRPAMLRRRILLRVRPWLHRALRARGRGEPRDVAAATITTTSPARQILWFGNHGAAHGRFGILDLLEIRTALEAVAADFPVELVVVSNHREKYAKHIRPLAIPSRYVEWSPAAMDALLATAAVVIVPNTRDPFSVCKSANRTVLALARGIPVVATPTPALDALADCIEHDDFEAGLRRYLADPDHAARHVARGRERIETLYGQQAIANAWHAAFDEVREAAGRKVAQAPELVVVLHLKQDLDLALPVIETARARGIPVAAWIGLRLLWESPRVAATLRALGVPSRTLPEDLDALRAVRLPTSVRGLLTASETNLKPHRFARALTEAVNRAGTRTATMQHGFENVGLTYADKLHAIDRVDFAARRIYLWGPVSTLLPDVPASTRERCVPVGCPKPAFAPAADLGDLLPRGRPVIGIFENLHWHRFDDDFRTFFITGVRRLAQAFPDITFLVKPHHAGMWLTSRFTGTAPVAPNLVIADPATRGWEAHTAPGLMGHMAAVITTPSTVALDAARRGIPTAVVARSMTLANYAPLPLIVGADDWDTFVADTRNPAARDRIAALATRFVERVLLAGDAPSRILDDLLDHPVRHRP